MSVSPPLSPPPPPPQLQLASLVEPTPLRMVDTTAYTMQTHLNSRPISDLFEDVSPHHEDEVEVELNISDETPIAVPIKFVKSVSSSLAPF